MIDNTRPQEISIEMTEWIDTSVYDQEGQRIGGLNNVVEQAGEVFAILDLSDTTRTVDSLYAVPWSSLDLEHEAGPRAAITVDEELLKDARLLEGAVLDELTGEHWKSSIFVYWPQILWPS